MLRRGDKPGIAMPVSLAQLYYLGSQNVALSDARTLARVAGLLSARAKDFQVLGESTTSFSDLRDRPVILIGALNNDWTRRLMGSLAVRVRKKPGDVLDQRPAESFPERSLAEL